MDRSDHPPADPVRKRPKQRRANDTVGTIVEATARIVRREGVQNLTTNRIAEVSGFSIGTLYQYFRNKDGVLLAMVERESRELTVRLREVFESGRDRPIEATLREAVRILIAAYRTPNRALRQALLSAAVHRGLMPRLYAYVREGESALAEMFGLLEGPEVRPLSPVARFVAARSVIGCLRATVLENSPIVDEAEFEDEVVRMVRSMLCRDRADLAVNVR